MATHRDTRPRCENSEFSSTTSALLSSSIILLSFGMAIPRSLRIGRVIRSQVDCRGYWLELRKLLLCSPVWRFSRWASNLFVLALFPSWTRVFYLLTLLSFIHSPPMNFPSPRPFRLCQSAIQGLCISASFSRVWLHIGGPSWQRQDFFILAPVSWRSRSPQADDVHILEPVAIDLDRSQSHLSCLVRLHAVLQLNVAPAIRVTSYPHSGTEAVRATTVVQRMCHAVLSAFDLKRLRDEL